MDWGMILIAAAFMIGAGFLLGGLLAVAAVRFHVQVDPRVEQVRGVLPGANCGACGLPGCDAAAAAIVDGKATIGACTAGGHTVKDAIAALLGIEAGETGEPQVTLVRCQGRIGVVKERYAYQGVQDCAAANAVAGGPLACPYGCLGFGSCVKACPFDAMAMGEDGLPVIELEKCTRCGICVATCPRRIIAFAPLSAAVDVLCVSRDRGKLVREACSAGCIACKACEKVCEPGAILVTDNLAVIDYAKCTGCGRCVEKCPTKCIVLRGGVPATA